MSALNLYNPWLLFFRSQMVVFSELQQNWHQFDLSAINNRSFCYEGPRTQDATNRKLCNNYFGHRFQLTIHFFEALFFALINDIMMVFALNCVQLPQITRRLKRFADFQREREQETKYVKRRGSRYAFANLFRFLKQIVSVL